VVLLEIPAATGAPVAFNSIAYIRIGSATPKLTDYPERYQQLIERMQPYRWEQGIARQYASGDDVLRLLDYSQYFRLTRQPLPDNRTGIFDKLEGDRLIVRDVGERWNITNLGAILFANRLPDFEASLARKAVRFVAYAGKNRAATVTHRHDGQKGYAVGFEGLVGYINDLLPKNEHIGAALREAHPLFPELAIRELVANALIHQDMTVSGAGPQIELFSDRIEISNPGAPLVKPERMIDLPPRSRNAELASLMRRMGMCEEQGSGLDKVVEQVEIFQLPAPLFRSEGNSTQVVLYGPRSFAEMTPEERVRACYFHAVLKFLSGDRMKNASLCARLGIASKNAAQATAVINNERSRNPRRAHRPRAQGGRLGRGRGQPGPARVPDHARAAGGRGQARQGLSADYVLEYRNTKLAVVEAKAWDKELTEGVGQAKDYAGKLAVRFTYATNGRGIYGIDMQTGAEGDVAGYPTPDELWA
jgi:ATP-dependent DNA helicase RecG